MTFMGIIGNKFESCTKWECCKTISRKIKYKKQFPYLKSAAILKLREIFQANKTFI